MLKPLQDRVVIKLIEAQEITKSGIILSNSMKENTKLAEVIEVSESGDNEEKKTYLKKGDKVIYNKYSGTEIMFGDDKYIILKQDDVLAIIE